MGLRAWFKRLVDGDPIVNGRVVAKPAARPAMAPQNAVSIASEGKHSGDFAEGMTGWLNPPAADPTYTLIVEGTTRRGKFARRSIIVDGGVYGSLNVGDPYSEVKPKANPPTENTSIRT